MTAVSRCRLLVGDGKNEIFPFWFVFHLLLYVLVYVEFSLSLYIFVLLKSYKCNIYSKHSKLQ